jgi:hypothetical protein
VLAARIFGKRSRCSIPLIAMLLAVAAFSPLHLLNLCMPRSGYELTRDIACGVHTRQRLDLYSPTEASASAPAVVFFYDGPLGLQIQGASPVSPAPMISSR